MALDEAMTRLAHAAAVFLGAYHVALAAEESPVEERLQQEAFTAARILEHQATRTAALLVEPRPEDD